MTTEKTIDFPPLPKPDWVSITDTDPGCVELRDNYSTKQMRDYVEADRAQRQAEPESRHVLQAEGKHPAPCAKFCEATAFKHEIRRLEREAAPPPAHVPAKWTPSEIANGCTGIRWATQDGVFGRPTADDVRLYLADLPDALR